MNMTLMDFISIVVVIVSVLLVLVMGVIVLKGSRWYRNNCTQIIKGPDGPDVKSKVESIDPWSINSNANVITGTVPLNGTNEIIINRIRLDYLAPIAHGIVSFSKTRNIKALGVVGRKLRSDYTWIEIYFMEHGFMDTGLNKLYIALESLEHTTQNHLDDVVAEVISLATYTETILEELAVKLSVSPWISGGVINRLVNESD